MFERVVRISGCLSLVAASVASAQPAEDTTAHASVEPAASDTPRIEAATPWDDDLIGGPRLRPIAGARLEALVSAGTHDTRNAALRGTQRRGPFAIELRGASDGRGASDAGDGRTRHEVGGLARFTHRGVELEALGGYDVLAQGPLSLTTGTYGARGHFAAKSQRVLGLDHELGIGAGVVELAGSASDDDPDMETHMKSLSRTLRGKHRYLRAYISDTIRVIERLDVRGGFIFEHWKWLTSYQTRRNENDMDAQLPEEAQAVLSPRVSAVYRIDDALSLRGDAYRTLHAPTFTEIYVAEVKPEIASTVELGPHVTAGAIEARTALFWTQTTSPLVAVRRDDGSPALANADEARATGVDTVASWHPVAHWRATVGYTYAHAVITRADAHPELVATQSALVPRHRASAAVTFDDPKLVTLTGAVRYVSHQLYDGAYTLVDAVAMRKLTGGVAAYLSVDNILDRRYITNATGIDAAGMPRTFAIGVRLDSAKF